MAEEEELREEAKELLKAIQKIDGKDKDIIIASLKGMLLVANINKKENAS